MCDSLSTWLKEFHRQMCCQSEFEMKREENPTFGEIAGMDD